MKTISETCAVCGEKYDGFDDGCSLEHWPDGVFLTPNGPWVCQDCIPDGWKMGVRKSVYDALQELRNFSSEID